MKPKCLTAERTLIYRSTVLKRPGWTEAALKRFAPEPDQLTKNPHYKSGPPSALYDVIRIEAIERSPEFTEWRKSADKRKSRAKTAAPKAVATRRARLLEFVRTTKIVIPEFSAPELRSRAIRHYNSRLRDDQIEKWINPDGPLLPSFEERITVNYLRHHQDSEYERVLAESYGRTGVEKAYEIIRSRVLDAIGRAYSRLNAECRRQKLRASN